MSCFCFGTYEGHYYIYFLLRWPLEKYNYDSGKAQKTPGIFVLLCGHPVTLFVWMIILLLKICLWHLVWQLHLRWDADTLLLLSIALGILFSIFSFFLIPLTHQNLWPLLSRNNMIEFVFDCFFGNLTRANQQAAANESGSESDCQRCCHWGSGSCRCSNIFSSYHCLDIGHHTVVCIVASL